MRRRLRLYEAIDDLQEREPAFSSGKFLTIPQTLMLATYCKLPKCKYVMQNGITRGCCCCCRGSYLTVGRKFVRNPKLVGVICDELPDFFTKSDIIYDYSMNKSDK